MGQTDDRHLCCCLDDSNESIYPACIFNDWAVSKTFLIIFKNEEVQLDDQFNFKLSVIVDAQNVRGEFNDRRDAFLFHFRSTNVLLGSICNFWSNSISSRKIIRM